MAMDWPEFEKHLEAARRSHPRWFEDAREPLPADRALEEAEVALGVRLPEAFKEFVRRIGGGYFGAINVFGVAADEWNIVENNRQFPLPEGFIAISDDEAGGYYGFGSACGVCSQDVTYCYPMEADAPKPVAPDFLSYLVRVGLKLP